MAKRYTEDWQDPAEVMQNVGLPLTSPTLNHVLEERVGADGNPAPVHEWDARIRAILTDTEYGRTSYGPSDVRRFDSQCDWIHLPFEELRERFTTDELTRAMCRCVLESPVSVRFSLDPHYSPLHKVPNSMWQYGRKADGYYKDAVRFYNGLARFDFGLPGFSAYFDHTAYEYGTEGRARYAKYLHQPTDGKAFFVPHWLDGVFAYHIVRDGKMVLTVGFSFASSGVLVSQIQTRGDKKGNRWLYSVKPGIREHVLTRLRLAFPHSPVRLITGQTQKLSGQYAHRREPDQYPDSVADRVAAFYDAPLAGYRFGDTVNTSAGWGPCRKFREVIPTDLAA
jgi:hypothetical protein